MDSENKRDERLDELVENTGKGSSDMLRESLSLLKPSVLGKKRFFIILFLSVSVSFVIGVRLESIKLLLEIVKIIETVVLTIYAVGFTAHSIFQALLSHQLVCAMVNTDDEEDNEISSFTGTNRYFARYMMLAISDIIISALILIAGVIIPSDVALFSNIVINDIIFALAICPYFFLSFMILFESYSLVLNIYNIYTLSALVEYLDEKREDKQHEKGSK